MGFYLELLPQEAITVRPLYNKFFKEIGIEIPLRELDLHFQSMVSRLIINPFNGDIGKLYAAYEEKPEYPLEFIGEPIGYLVFYINRDVTGKSHLFIDQIYSPVDSEILKNFLEIIADHYARARCSGLRVHARNRHLAHHWRMFGLVHDYEAQRFDGTIDELRMCFFNKFKEIEHKSKLFKRRDGDGRWDKTRASTKADYGLADQCSSVLPIR